MNFIKHPVAIQLQKDSTIWPKKQQQQEFPLHLMPHALQSLICWEVRDKILRLSRLLCCFRYSIRSACFSTTSSKFDPILKKVKKEKSPQLTISGTCYSEYQHPKTYELWTLLKTAKLTSRGKKLCAGEGGQKKTSKVNMQQMPIFDMN